MTEHVDRLHHGYSKSFAEGYNKIDWSKKGEEKEPVDKPDDNEYKD